MTEVPHIVDSSALKRRRERAKPSQLFLQNTAREEFSDRLRFINQSFQKIAIVTPFAQIWSDMDAELLKSDEDELLFDDPPYDLILHSLALHWSNDPVGALIQCTRALRPDGLFLGAALGGETLTELRQCLRQAEIEVTGGLSPRVAPMAEIRDWGTLLGRAGLALPVADSVPLNVEYQSIWHLMHDLREMGESNALTGRLRVATKRQVFERCSEIYQSSFPGGEGRIKARFELIILTGWAPAASQPKPLRPGSARARLADALGSKETKL